MNKEKLRTYLNSQIEKIDSKNFELNPWKLSTLSLFDSVFGPGNSFSGMIGNLEYDMKLSRESLYPENVRDVKKSKLKFKQVLSEIIDLIELEEDEVIEASRSSLKGAETLSQIVKILHNSLTGNQLLELKKVIKEKKKKAGPTILEIIKTYDLDTSQEMLAGIISSKEIWDLIED